MKSLSIVLPAYNEDANIRATLEDVSRVAAKLAAKHEIIVVSDGSRDRTSDVVREYSHAHACVRLIEHATNMGYGSAVWDGLIAAGNEWVFFTDSDRQFDLDELANLVALAPEADIVAGYRAPRRDPWMRRLNAWGWRLLVTLFFGRTLRDIDCAFKLIRRDVIRRLEGRVRSRGATFSAEFMVLAKRDGCRIVEAPLAGHRPRVAGCATGARMSVILRAFCELIRLRLALWSRR